MKPSQDEERKNENDNIDKLIEEQRRLSKEIHESNNKKERLKLKEKKRHYKKRKSIKEEKEEQVKNLIEEIKNSKEDSHRMYKAIGNIQRKQKT